MASELPTIAVLVDVGDQDLRSRCAALVECGELLRTAHDHPFDLLIADVDSGRWLEDGRPAGSLAVGGQVSAADASLEQDFTDREFWLAVSLLQQVIQLRALQRSRREREATLDKLAHTDPLTGLPNRRAWEGRPAGDPRRRAIVFLDVDGLKTINRDHGHEGGDRVLSAVGAAVRSSIRNADLPARLGGDEFVVLLEDVNLPTAQTVTCRLVREVNRAASAALAAPVTISAGLAAGDDDDALAAADREMRQAKLD
ncbi:MAG: GGDEF domain-containing protein [Pirellulaceae bacterium]|jgi:diguanylate cyclase (GGDEF)-like protein|nr:GGDEF domain-containing protein [Pirellulaceae bacterium]MDP7020177.1 GGDEF domain-containing protein [Pirellulaceae bacterium]